MSSVIAHAGGADLFGAVFLLVAVVVFVTVAVMALDGES